jgi:hypothetical protein
VLIREPVSISNTTSTPRANVPPDSLRDLVKLQNFKVWNQKGKAAEQLTKMRELMEDFWELRGD